MGFSIRINGKDIRILSLRCNEGEAYKQDTVAFKLAFLKSLKSINDFFLEPVVKVPSQDANLMPQFLPDPRHGFLYTYGPRGDQQMLKKLPFTIPELVANAPCRSTDGILYTGKKSDTWFMIDPLTGFREHVSGILLTICD